MLDYSLLCALLLLLMFAALLLARWLGARQEQAVVNLYRLSALEKRQASIEGVIDALRDMGADRSVLDILYEALLRDLGRIRELDPRREDLDDLIREAEAGRNRKSKAPPPDQAAVNTEEELHSVRRHMQKAMQLLALLNQHGGLGTRKYGEARARLQSLAINIGVNSYMLMAEKALEKRNTMRAFSMYRKAESLLEFARLRDEDKKQRLELIKAEKQRLMEQYEDEKGLLLLASAD